MSKQEFSNVKELELPCVKPGMTRQEVMSLLSTGTVCYSTAVFVSDDLTSDRDVDEAVLVSRDGRLDAMDLIGMSGAVSNAVAQMDAAADTSASSTSGQNGKPSSGVVVQTLESGQEPVNAAGAVPD